MKSNRYYQGVSWIALNDNSGSDDDVQKISEYISTTLLADLFNVSCEDAAKDIFLTRQANA